MFWLWLWIHCDLFSMWSKYVGLIKKVKFVGLLIRQSRKQLIQPRTLWPPTFSSTVSVSWFTGLKQTGLWLHSQHNTWTLTPWSSVSNGSWIKNHEPSDPIKQRTMTWQINDPWPGLKTKNICTEYRNEKNTKLSVTS